MKIFKVIALALSTFICMAEEIQQGKLYPGGSYIESSQTGIGLTIPQGWQGVWPPGSEMFVLESAALKANIFMVSDIGDDAGLIALMSNPIPLDSSVTLVPISAPKKTGNTYTAKYSIVGAPKVSGYIAARILPSSLGAAFIALSADASTTQQVEQVTLKLANSLTVKQTQLLTSPPPAYSGGTLWKDYFKGRHIARLYTGSNYNENQHLWLCSDGRFLRKSGSGGYSMSGASGASSSQGEGYWTATGSTGGEGQLILQFGTGTVSETSISVSDYTTSNAGGERWVYRVSLGEKLYLDGKLWLRDQNNVCN